MLSKFIHSAVLSRCFLIFPFVMWSNGNQLQWIEQTFCLQVSVYELSRFTVGRSELDFIWRDFLVMTSPVFASLSSRACHFVLHDIWLDNNSPALNMLEFTTVLAEDFWGLLLLPSPALCMERSSWLRLQNFQDAKVPCFVVSQETPTRSWNFVIAGVFFDGGRNKARRNSQQTTRSTCLFRAFLFWAAPCHSVTQSVCLW